jgi:3-oxoacyl-[acyl-carrier protein] reductase
VQVVQAVLPGMVEAGWGRIVNVTSLTTLGVAERTPTGLRKSRTSVAPQLTPSQVFG